MRKLFFLAFLVPMGLFASFTFHNGKLVKVERMATLSLQEHYSLAIEAYQEKDWEQLIEQTEIIFYNFPNTPFAADAYFYNGIGYYYIGEYYIANRSFSEYLLNKSPKYFEEALQYKFAIGEKFREKKGKKPILFGLKDMPKWLSAYDEALEIYDEIIAVLPHHDLSARSLYSKGLIHLKEKDFKESAEAFDQLIHRFPRHDLSAAAYAELAKLYFMKCQRLYPDPDFLELAEMNLRSFERQFPRDEKQEKVKNLLKEMKEYYAKNLLETGQFYERTHHSQAAKIYYRKVIASFPESKSAALAQERLNKL